MMADGGMALIGSHPNNGSSNLYTYDTYSKTSSPFTKKYSVSSNKSHVKGFIKTPNGDFDSIFESAGNKTPSEHMKKPRSLVKTKPSYVDELLFGAVQSACREDACGTPLESARTATPGFETKSAVSTVRSTSRCESVVSRRQVHSSPSVTTTSQTQPRKASAKRYRSKHEPSYVDEMLFGPKKEDPGFNAPWDKVGDTKPQLFSLDCTDYRKTANKGNSQQNIDRNMFARGSASQQLSNRAEISRPASRVDSRMGSRAGYRPSSSRPASRQTISRPQSSHQRSYVDETLFGPKPEESDWPAPWEDPKKKKVPTATLR